MTRRQEEIYESDDNMSGQSEYRPEANSEHNSQMEEEKSEPSNFEVISDSS